ncbi:MAG: hypothetical protein QOH26_1112 [Actinomycetota bacterium]|nr:hypothetical protein [Actinomycetota bacterium]
MRRPGKKSLVVLGVVGLLVVAGSTAQAGWLFVLAAGVAGLLGGSLFVPQRLRFFKIERSVPLTAVAGQEVPVTITVRNSSRRRSPLARLEDRAAGLEPASFVCERAAPGAISTARSSRRAPRRGVFDGGEVRLRAGAPFGFVEARRDVQVPSRVVVVPQWVDLRSFPILEPASAPRDVLHERARTGAGEEYLGVRPYRPGDPRRHVHWRSSARRGSLVVREYEEHVQTKVGLVLAGVDAGTPPDSAFEALVSATASIGHYALRTGHPIEIVMAGSVGVRDLVRPSRNGMLQWLAEAAPSDESLGPLAAAAIRGVGRRGTVVFLVTSGSRAGRELEEAVGHVQAAGARALAVIADSASWQRDEPGASTVPMRLIGGRSAVRVLRKGKDLRACLQG